MASGQYTPGGGVCSDNITWVLTDSLCGLGLLVLASTAGVMPWDVLSVAYRLAGWDCPQEGLW